MKSFYTALLAIASVAGISNSSFAGERSPLISGVKAGIHMSQIDGHSWDQTFRVNLHGGMFLGVRGRSVGVQTEVNFNQNTYKTGSDFHQIFKSYYNDIKDSVKQGSFVVNTITVPLLFQVRPFLGVWLQAGPEYSMVLSVKDKDQLLTDTKAMFNRGAVNGVLGVWLQHGRHFNSGARYVFAVTDLNNSTIKDAWGGKSIQLHLGLNF